MSFFSESDWRGALSALGLGDAHGMLRAPVGEVVRVRPGREVRRIALPDGRVAFLKRIAAPGPRATLRALAQRDTRSSAEREAHELRRVLAAGVAASRPLAFAAQRVLGIPRASALLTEAVPGAPLDAVLAAADSARRTRIARALGEVFARMHRAGILHELRSADVSVSGDVDLALIDRDPKDSLAYLASAPQPGLACLARCEYLRRRGGAALSCDEREALLEAYGNEAKPALSLPRMREIAAELVRTELARHRATPALVARFGVLED